MSGSVRIKLTKAITLDEVTVNAVVIYGTIGEDKPTGQFFSRLVDGTPEVEDVGQHLTLCTVLLKRLSYDDHMALRTFIREKLNYRQYQFKIEALDCISEIDFGNGKGVAIESANMTSDSLVGVYTPKPPGVYDWRLEFEIIREEM